MITLTNNKLILNGHRILDINQLWGFFSKKFKSEVNSEFDIKNILKDYKDLTIAIRHADTFLKNETAKKHDEIIKMLEYFGVVKQTGRIKK